MPTNGTKQKLQDKGLSTCDHMVDVDPVLGLLLVTKNCEVNGERQHIILGILMSKC